MQAPQPLLECILALYFRQGYPFTDANREIERMRLEFEWNSGQWVMLTDKATDRLWGWASWWRVSRELLEKIRVEDFVEDAQTGHPRELLVGPCVYISRAVVAPYAPDDTFRRLCEMVGEANNDAESVSAHIRKRNGQTRWLHRTFQEGFICPSAQTSKKAQAEALH